ncbi:MAG: C4-type zinc ribbon domain-containing protein [Verrucomicrobiota bacterium]|nr:C4-type zinc ribbon domain-containing protein [Verrucomicrobiota bacterium]
MILSDLQQLLVIQDRDKKINYLKLEQKQIPEEEKAINDKLKAQSQSMEDLKLKMRHVEATRKNSELNVQSKRDSIAKFKTQQLQTRKNEEYQALAHEVKRYSEDIVVIEDGELELMQEHENLKKLSAEEEVRVKKYKDDAAITMVELTKKAAVVATQLAALLAERVELSSKIDPSLFSKYERIMISKKDAAIVPIVHGQTCSGCNVKATPTTINSAKSGKEITQCENCGRMVYFEE